MKNIISFYKVSIKMQMRPKWILCTFILTFMGMVVSEAAKNAETEEDYSRVSVLSLVTTVASLIVQYRFIKAVVKKMNKS